MLTLYGIVNCDTIRKVRRMLEQHGIEHEFIDLREQIPSVRQLQNWLDIFGESLINKRSSTYREHKEAILLALDNDNDAIVAILQRYPTLIKRPVIEVDGKPYSLGWQEDRLQRLL